MQARMLTQQRTQEEKIVFYAITASLLLHIAFFTIFVVLPGFGGGRNITTPPIYIQIVGGGGGAPGPMPTVTDTPPATNVAPSGEKQPNTTKPDTNVEPVYIPPPATQTVTPSDYGTATTDADTPKPDDDVNVKTISSQTIKNKDATKKVEEIQRSLQQTQQQTQQATQRSEAAVNQSQSGTESVNSAIQQIRDKQAAQNVGGGGTGTGIGTGTGAGSGAGGSGFGGVGSPLDVYLNIIVPIIERNWSFSPSMFKGTPNMEVLLEVDILSTGEISDIRYVKKSGDVYLDESAFKAMAKSSPLPAYKDSGIREARITLQFRFTPKGLKR